jgi:hypothetical protein
MVLFFLQFFSQNQTLVVRAGGQWCHDSKRKNSTSEFMYNLIVHGVICIKYYFGMISTMKNYASNNAIGI